MSFFFNLKKKSIRDKVMDLHYDQNSSKAVKLVDSYIRQYPKESYLYELKHEILSDCHKHSEALVVIDKALAIKETPALCYCKALTLSSHELGRYSESLYYFDKALEDISQLHNKYMYKGETLILLNRKQESRNCYNKALEILIEMREDDDQSYFPSLEIECLRYLDRIDDSLTLCDKYISDDPYNLHFHQCKIETLIYQEKYKEALVMCEKTLSFDVDNEDFFVHLYLLKARLHALLGDKSTSLEVFKKTLSLDSTVLNEFHHIPKELVEINSMYNKFSV